MNRTDLSKLVADAGAKLEEVRKNRKGLEHALARVQPFLSKYIFDANAPQSVEFKVCTKGPVCCQRGSLELLAQLKEMADGKPDVSVAESLCLHRCSRGPNIQSAGVVFTDMTAEKARSLFENEVGKKGLAVELLLDDEYAPEVSNTEEKRCRLLISASDLADAFNTIADQSKVLSGRLPEDRTERFLSQRAVLDAIKLHNAIFEELDECELLLKKVVPLDRFCTSLFERDYKEWLKSLKRSKRWTFQS